MSTMRTNGDGWQILDGTSCKDVKRMQNGAPNFNTSGVDWLD